MEINIEEYLKRFKIYYDKSLFPPNFENLSKGLCPVCNRKLYWTRDLSKAFCKSKVKDKFFITRNAMSRMGFV